MRKDSIAEGAYQKALEMYQFSERGFHGSGVDADDVPVLAPQVSKLKKEDAAWQPNSAFYGNQPRGSAPTHNFSEETGTGEYNGLEAELVRLMQIQDDLGGQLRRARQLGSFKEEHRSVQERNDIMKAISAVEAQMMVLDNGRFRRGMNDGMMYESQDRDEFSEYVSAIEENDEKIARLEAALLEFAEKMKGKDIKSTGGDAAADPGQSYDTADDEEDDEDMDEEELGEA